MRFSRIFSDILPESNIFATHMVRRFGGIGRKVVNFRPIFTHLLILAGLMTRILVRVLVATLYSCIMLSFLDVASCHPLFRSLLPKRSSLELVHKRFNSVGN